MLDGDARWAESSQGLINATAAAMHSTRFANALTRRSGLHVSGKLFGDVDGWVALAAIWRISKKRQMLPTFLSVANDLGTGVAAQTGICAGTTYAQVRLNPFVLRQWAQGDTEQQSCAINTLAHELAHTVFDGNHQLFRDGWLIHDLVSYAIGSIAQCVYLEEASGKVMTDDAFDKCVKTWGLSGARACALIAGPDVLDRYGVENCSVARPLQPSLGIY